MTPPRTSISAETGSVRDRVGRGRSADRTKVVFSAYRLRALHLVALWAYGVSQPVFSLLKANPEFLVVRGSSRAEVVVFALALVLVPPLGALALQLAVRIASARAADLLHLGFIGAFATPIALQLLKTLEANRVAAMLGTAAIALLAVLAYARVRAVSLFLSFSIVLPLIGLGSFVLGVPLAAADDLAGANLRVKSQTPVVLLVLDELPVSSLLTSSGVIDARRYPSFARLARHGTWYRRATTVHEHTSHAVPAIFDGRLPVSGALPTVSDHPQNVFTLLGESYDVQAFEPLTHLCPRRYCRGRDRGSLGDRLRGLFSDVRVAYLHRVVPDSLAGGLPRIDDRWAGFGEDEVGPQDRNLILGVRDLGDFSNIVERAFLTRTPRADFGRFLSSIRRGEPARTLHVLHLLLPHSPWYLLPSGRDLGRLEGNEGCCDSSGRWIDDPWVVAQAYQLHLLQVSYTDVLLGRLLDRLEATGLYEDALVIVTADHGTSFVAGKGRRSVEREHLADIARIPLLIKYPGQRQGVVDERRAWTIDIFPTIADVVGARLPLKVDGRSLLKSPLKSSMVVVGRPEASSVSATASEVERSLAVTVRSKSMLFGEGNDSLYAIGQNQHMLGRRVGRVQTISRSASVHFDGEELLDSVNLSSSFVPALITGHIEGVEVSADLEFAVAVNGRIAALTHRFLRDDEQRFSALVPENVFRDGSNRVQLLAIGGTRAAPRLTLIRQTGSS